MFNLHIKRLEAILFKINKSLVESDDRLARDITRLNNRIEALEKFLDVEYVEEKKEFKGYRKKVQPSGESRYVTVKANGSVGIGVLKVTTPKKKRGRPAKKNK